MPLTIEQRRDYERAAVALENGEDVTGMSCEEIALAAFRKADELLPEEDGTPDTDEAACDNRAARLLRECIAEDMEI